MRNRVFGPIVAVAAAVSVAACGSSGGSSGSVSTTQLETKLKNEPMIKQVINTGGAKSKIANQLVDCIAKAIQKNASKSDVSDYVHGKKQLGQLGGDGAGAASDAKTCAENAVKNAK